MEGHKFFTFQYHFSLVYSKIVSVLAGKQVMFCYSIYSEDKLVCQCLYMSEKQAPNYNNVRTSYNLRANNKNCIIEDNHPNSTTLDVYIIRRQRDVVYIALYTHYASLRLHFRWNENFTLY